MRWSTWPTRLAFAGVALGFSLLTLYVYSHVLVPARVFDYMGIRSQAVLIGIQATFLAIAVLPCLWLPLHLRTPTDIVELFLYFAVHIPSATLMPVISYSPTYRQLEYCAAITLGLLGLEFRRLLPTLTIPRVRLGPDVLWVALLGTYAWIFVVFARSGYLSLQNANLVSVYDERADLAAHAAEIGKIFFYAANWTGVALAPFLVAAGLYRKRYVLIALGIVIAAASFIVSSNRMNYMAIPAVIAGYYLLRYTRGRNLATVMAVGFIALTFAMLQVDAHFGVRLGDVSIPALTWQVFHRTFSNNGLLSAVYLDTFHGRPPAFYADSFLRWLPGPRLEAPVPLIAGSSFTDVQGNFANANLWADAYANLGYLGIASTSILTSLLLWVYDGIVAGEWLLGAAALIVPAAVLANTSTHSAMTSNGMLFVFVLMYVWPRRESAPLASQGTVRSATG